MSKTFDIVALPGDGVGVEVTEAALRVLREVESRLDEVSFNISIHAVGASEYQRNGDPLPSQVVKTCRDADAVFLGAMGLPDVRWPDGREMTPQIDLREQLQLYAGLRPIRLYHENDCPLKGYKAGSIDLLIVRESTEGLFSARLSKSSSESGEVRDVMRITRRGSERVCHAAYREAMQRRKKLTLVDKANVLPSMVYMRSIFDTIGQDFPEVTTNHDYVDATALYLLRRPESYDVIVTENMFGDILSDLAAGLVGGMGMAPSGDIGDECAVFQPCHGTAPDIAGKGIANPVAAILSTAMMLEWLKHPETQKGAKFIQDAVELVLKNPADRTPDGGGGLTTRSMTDKILGNL